MEKDGWKALSEWSGVHSVLGNLAILVIPSELFPKENTNFAVGDLPLLMTKSSTDLVQSIQSHEVFNSHQATHLQSFSGEVYVHMHVRWKYAKAQPLRQSLLKGVVLVCVRIL